MKKESSNRKGKNEMKNDQNPVADREAQEPHSEQTMGGDLRIQQLADLARDGDETAAAELELIFALA